MFVAMGCHSGIKELVDLTVWLWGIHHGTISSTQDIKFTMGLINAKQGDLITTIIVL
jgi:hypothetical protein